jgi:hypothetical protein
MLTFSSVNVRNAAKLRKYYKNCSYRLCEYSLGVKLMWKHHFSPTFAQEGGCLIVKSTSHGRTVFDYPVPLNAASSIEEAITAIEDYCREQGICPVFYQVPEEELGRVLPRYPCAQLENNRLWQDYLYRAEDLITFAGRHYSGQRNHINKFRKLYPEALFRPIVPEDAEKLEQFWDEFHRVFHKESALAKKELCYARKLTRQIGKPWLLAGAIELEGRFLAISVGEICGDTLVCHIEKALPDYEGIYPTMVQSFAAHFAGKCTYINREDDGADRGLRTSKTQYHPCAMGSKYKLITATELTRLKAIPTLHTGRLLLDAIQPSDRDAYNRLCLDDARNRLWGYDYRKDLKGPLTDNYFYRVARNDFKNRMALNFAIRLEDQFIGEVVLYHFDCKGAAELGCRILPEFDGNGYGAEAFAAAADWALYELGLTRLEAKCFKENEASQKMLTACMRPQRKDDTFYYYEKLI